MGIGQPLDFHLLMSNWAIYRYINLLLLTACVAIVSVLIVSNGQDSSVLEEELASYEGAIRQLEGKSGKSKLRSQYLIRLEDLVERTHLPDEKLLLEAEIQYAKQAGFPKRSHQTFADLKRLQAIYDSALASIHEQSGPEFGSLNDAFRAKLVQLIISASDPERVRIQAELEKRFGKASPAIPSSKPSGRSSLLRFSVLQEQRNLPPEKSVHLLAFPQDRDELNALLSAADEGDFDTSVGEDLPEDTKVLEVPGVSRTLLIYSGDGESREIHGSITIQGKAAVDLEPAEGESSLRLKIGNEGRPLTLDGGEVFILEKEEKAAGTFEVKAGTSTISVRGTEVYLLPKSGELDHTRSKRSADQGFRKDEETVLLVRDGQVAVEGGPHPQGALVGDLEAISLQSGSKLPGGFERDPYAKTYTDHLKYYPRADGWLVADFDSGYREGLGPMVECLGWVDELMEPEARNVRLHGNPGQAFDLPQTHHKFGYNEMLVLSFPPVDGNHYRYLSFDFCHFTGTELVKGSSPYQPGDIRPLWIYVGEMSLGDPDARTIKVSGDSLSTEKAMEWKRGVIDLWAVNATGQAVPEEILETIVMYSSGRHLLIDNVELLRDKPDAEVLELEVAQEMRSYMPMMIASYGSTYSGGEYGFIGWGDDNMFRSIANLYENQSENGKFSETVIKGFNDGRRKGTPSFSPEEIHIMVETCRQYIMNGSGSLSVDLSPTDIYTLVALEYGWGHPGAGFLRSPETVFEEFGVSNSLLRRIEKAGWRLVFGDRPASGSNEPRLPEDDSIIELFAAMHEQALKRLASMANPDNNPVIWNSRMVWGGGVDVEDTKQILRLGSDGSITKEDLKP